MERRPRGLDGAALLAWMEGQCLRTPTGCLEWQRDRTAKGYGRLEYKGEPVLATRLADELRHGPIPTGLLILHQCDNPPCIEDGHLLRGTMADNMHDMSVRGRAGCRFGLANNKSKLTPEQVRAIRKDKRSTVVLGLIYGVSSPAISKIKRRITWAHLPD